MGGRYSVWKGSRMDAKSTLLNEKLESLLKQAAAVASELQSIEQGTDTPHFDEIELPAHDLGQRRSRMIQSDDSVGSRLRSRRRREDTDCLSRLFDAMQGRTPASHGQLDGRPH